MSSAEVYDSLIVEVSAMKRAAMLTRLGGLAPELRLDFSAGFLEGCDDEKLRHVLLAALWRSRMKGQGTGGVAADQISERSSSSLGTSIS